MAGATEYEISLGSVAPAAAIADRLIAELARFPYARPLLPVRHRLPARARLALAAHWHLRWQSCGVPVRRRLQFDGIRIGRRRWS